jgi:hypothetical protein
MRIGDAVNKEKAEEKARNWKDKEFMYGVDIRVGPVVKTTYKDEIEKLIPKYNLVKVILMTSGSWEGTYSNRKYGLDLNFKDPSIELANKYSHLYILAMITQRYKMNVNYLHNKIIQTVVGSGRKVNIVIGNVDSRKEVNQNEEIKG